MDVNDHGADGYVVSGEVKRFPGPTGWHYLELPLDLDPELRPLVRQRWPALLSVRCTLGRTTWDGSIMPIKAGPLFIAVPARVRTSEGVVVGSAVTISFEPRLAS